MQPSHRSVQVGLGALVVLHLIALAAPGAFWGVSHLAAWPWPVGVAWTLAALVALALAPRWARASERLVFPGRRGAMLVALGVGALAYLAHERSHFFGDGNLIARSLQHGSVTYWRAPLLVRPATWIVLQVERTVGWPAATTLAVLSVLAGMAATYAALRAIAVLTPRTNGRFLFASLLTTSGAVQLFFGHVEFYAGLALALVAWTWWVFSTLAAARPTWPTWFATALLPTLHLSATCLLPAQGVIARAGWRRRERWSTVAIAIAAAALAFAVLHAFGREPRRALQPAASRILGAFFDRSDIRHAFTLWSPAHALAVLNQLLLVAPIALVAVPLAVMRRRHRVPADYLHADTVRFVFVAALGALALDFLFGRELGPYRDWDTLASYAWFYLLAAGVLLLRAGFESRTVAILILIAGVHHTLPWLLMQTSPERTVRHLHAVLATKSQWSPYARGYLFEDLAIARRDAGDLGSARREYEAAIAANPSDARYRVGAGDMARRLGDLDAAIANYEAALERRPEFAPAHNNLAITLLTVGTDLDRAREHSLTAIRIEPRNLNHQLTLGFIELARWDLDAARRQLDLARTMQPDSPNVQRLEDALQKRATAERGTPLDVTPAP